MPAMSMPQRESLIARIRHLHRVAGSPETRSPASKQDPISAGEVHDARLQAVEARIAHVERLLEGLQDSVHRESLRQGKRIAELDARIQPAVLGAALSKDARERGL